MAIINKKVFVGMSGGVDSSVSAALLKERGFDVVGVFIKVWEPPKELLPGGCTWRDDRRDAMRVAAGLDIPFITIDLSEEYKKEVIDYMVNEYKAGRTPNPDVMCNKQIKFGAFYNWAMKNGADYVATGHYAQVKENKDTSLFELHAGADKNKDQSYFLWTLSGEILSHTIFPIGHLEKTEVRKLGAKFGLPNAEKKDSQGLCFVGMIDAKDFLKSFIEERVGDVANEKGEIIGRHDGAMFYTIGERHGFEIFDKYKGKPLYVIAKDMDKNVLVVSEKKESDSGKKESYISNVNWNTDEPVGKDYQVRGRYRQELEEAKIIKEGDKWKVILQNPKEPLVSGQSLVAYDGSKCLGGGVIV